ncbi:hypothetical protein QQS21_003305 [Conoideocrella luteorostrata]|uniref:Cytochrome P450 n=1 Tax=Conoideocrella luteorostrata TaxID=1105319 RepID=A0AAJ0FVN7_9HYPO|nr:hypothetical protein QQS21_003305 [Conoideocrella luteorostrata]
MAGCFNRFYMNQFRQHGRTFVQRTPVGRTVSTIEVDNFRTVLALKFDDYSKEPVRSEAVLQFLGLGIFTKDGPGWKHSRELLRPLFRRAELSDVHRFEKHVDRMLSLIPRDGSTFDMAPLLGKLFLDSGTEFTFGESFGSLDENSVQGDELLEACYASLIGISKRRHAVGKFGLLFDKSFDENVRKVHAFVDRQVARALAATDPRNLSAVKPLDDTASLRYVLLDEAAKTIRDPVELRFEMMNVFLPAFESISVVMSNALFHIARQPEIWSELRQKAMALGDQPLSFELLKSLTHFRYVMLEALRLHGSSSRLVRTATNDTVLPCGGGPDGSHPVFVPKGTQVSLDLLSHLNDAEVWGNDVEAFRPSRFEGRVTKWEFVPFSGGPRICPAQQQVITQSVYLLVRMVREFETIQNRDPCLDGTPTSTTTSLSALSTTAIKDGHRGHFASGPSGRGHQHNPSTTSLEAERADRISRLAGLERVSTLRAPGAGDGGPSSISPQTTPTSTTGGGFPPNFPTTHNLTPSYFDNNGQPMAVTKMSTVGSASATESHVGDDSRTTAGEREEDMFSNDTNYREAGSVASMGADPDAMDEDMDMMGTRSVGGYEDRMSDDGSASLVGFGEGAGSTVSGPIYHRRPPPGASAVHPAWNLERTNSGMSEPRRDKDTLMGGGDPVAGASSVHDRRDPRMMDGVAADPPRHGTSTDQDNFVDTTFRGPMPTGGQQNREAAERIVQTLDSGESRAGPSGLGSPGAGGQPLGKFYFEGDKRRD